MVRRQVSMEKEWKDLSPDEKREERFKWLLTTEGINFVSPEAENAYTTRAQRMIAVYKVQEPDRVPVSMPVGFMPAYRDGTDLHTVMYDSAKAVQAWTKFNREFEMDTYASPAGVPAGRIFDMLDYKLYLWPGHGLPTSASGFQFVEGEYMKPDEYDALIRDPSDFWMRVYLPRVFGSLESFRMLKPLPNLVEMPNVHAGFMPYTRPEVQASLRKLIDVGKELSAWTEVIAKVDQRGPELGFPIIKGSFCKAPFDTLGDTLRGTRGIMMDMYRRPDKLLEALEVIANLSIASAIDDANETGGLLASFPLHKGADGWMSAEQFETFYWPSLKKVMNAFIDEGLIVSLFAEGSYNTRLESINEFPKGTVTWLFDQTDMARAKEVLGANCCISGNVPSSLLFNGTPQGVKEYCRRLIEVCGKGGGFILAPGAIDVNAKPENIKAMMEAAKEYGVYK
jgi:uroporphyrinogen-III decarboxylase